ncbi:MAG: hypothetical protein WAO98_05905 [Alphaproteobacteria bacterium]
MSKFGGGGFGKGPMGGGSTKGPSGASSSGRSGLGGSSMKMATGGGSTSSGRSSMGGTSNSSYGSLPKSGSKVAEKMTSDNYQRLYQERKAAEMAAHKKKELDVAKKNDANSPIERMKMQQKLHEEQQANLGRTRAKQIQGEIGLLRSQLGADPTTNARIESEIQNLSNELSGIPGKFW